MTGIQHKAQEAINRNISKAKVLVSDAAISRSYVYPIKGVLYFGSHPAIWKPLVQQIMPMVGISVGVVSCMFFFTYIPQLSVLVFVNGPLAIFTTALLVLSESSAVITLIARNWVLKDAIIDTFDGVLLDKNAGEPVAEGREPVDNKMVGKVLKSPLKKLGPKAILHYVMYLPLNFIPVVGTAIFILIQGHKKGRNIHARYFQLKMWSASQQDVYLEKHKGPYTAFGLVATLLEMTPFVSILFSFTNAVGAALWATDLEGKNAMAGPNPASNLEGTSKKVD